ncbi:uncharacterized protein BO97DRAFT_419875 [Aspergillus homomorphus CBS 101889]|uniref:Uncharacterized protein n=1 Tax=Aspergillus homomorphus (strain CBS 101889) TaxID=1450537 RepID=A0A395ICT8_ASPHC|nr:hypothetical protein BO97DRAFT_419875 [Aspergillus homomorphus CBS 101889]RAL17639.1 hypothetical protein BO97DRAFT_419875 [Aspergillus homomorphus CBS 101889]
MLLPPPALLFSYQPKDHRSPKRLSDSGKSTIAVAVTHRVNALSPTPFAITLTMDGFYYPKHHLDTLPNAAEAYARRGAQYSLRQTIRALHFDHALGDPTAGAIAVSPDVSFNLVERYDLAVRYNVPAWAAIYGYVGET